MFGLSKHLIHISYIQSKQDYSIFTKTELNGDFTDVVVYVDDLLINGNSLSQISFVKQSLHEASTIKDLGHLKYFLGIEVTRTASGILLNQRKYILDLLKDFNLEECKSVSIPFQKNLHLSNTDTSLLPDRELYRRMVGKILIWICYFLGSISYFLESKETKDNFEEYL